MKQLETDIDWAALEARLHHCLISDAAVLRKRLAGLRGRARRGQPIDQGLATLLPALDAAEAKVRERAQKRPRPAFDEALPIVAAREEILSAIGAHQVVVICGETGSGKTTQLPKLCLEAGLASRGLIGHTQPRRIAARSVATRIAEELHQPIGQAVGFKVRFSDHTDPGGYIKLMTDGILLAETRGDPDLLAYEVIIVDEAHERSLNIDFLLGYLTRLLKKRPELKLIITSATIDPQRFARHFGDAPVINVSGRTYPVEMRYRPLGDAAGEGIDLTAGILDAVDELCAEGPGDVLVFLPGERDIREAAEALRKHHPPATEILPLFARLSAADQMRVFKPGGRRRIVLATNVAETSLTVPGIRYVVDSGLARISRYSTRAKLQRLPIEPVSQASANQRAGRCGRVAAGVCIRLYGEDDYSTRPVFTDPEILRTNLAAVVLQMASLNLGSVEDFPFVEPPERRQITDAYTLLHELGAVDGERRITRMGHKLASLPVDPRLARMILAAQGEGCVRDVLILAAALAIQDPRERPMDAQAQADQAHRRFHDPRSDFLALLRLWDWFADQGRHLSRSKLRETCKKQFLNYLRMREWQDLYRQLADSAAAVGLSLGEREAAPAPEADAQTQAAWPTNVAAIHRALLAGLLSHIGRRQEDGSYLGARQRRFHVFPGSGLARKSPPWLMAAEIVETARVFGRINARIDPSWAEQLGGHLIRRSYTNVRWEAKPAQVAADETVTLYGLTLTSGRRVHYGPIDPAVSRMVFIRDGLVEGGYRSNAPFLKHNRALVAEVEALETRARRRDLLVDPQTLVAFYDERIPADIYSGSGFEGWRRKAEKAQPRLLFFEPDDVAMGDTGEVTDRRYPPRLRISDLSLPLSYRFEPGAADDGVTLEVPLAALNLLRPEPLEWLIPGLLAERIAALVKALPKGLRKPLVPVPDSVAALIADLETRPPEPDAGLLETLSARIAQRFGLHIETDDWQPGAIPDHLRLNIRVRDAEGRIVDEARDLDALQLRLRQAAGRAFADLAKVPVRKARPAAAANQGRAEPAADWDRPVVRWDVDALPEAVTFQRQGTTLKGYPALVVEGEGLRLALRDDPYKAASDHRAGVRTLILREHRDKIAYLRRHIPGLNAMALHFVRIGSQQALVDDLIQAAVERAYFDDGVPRDQAAYRAALERGGPRLVPAATELAALVADILARHHEAGRRLPTQPPAPWGPALEDIRQQLADLVYPGFITATPAEWLVHLPRYLQAVGMRLDKLAREPERDRRLRPQIEDLIDRYRKTRQAHRHNGWFDPALIDFGWWLEEYRVSLFAQGLKTAGPVSAKRLEALWAQVRKR